MSVSPADVIGRFCDLLAASLSDGSFVRTVLSRYRGPEADLQRVDMRRVLLRGVTQLQLVYHHSTRDITKNLCLAEAVETVRGLLGAAAFRNAHLHTTSQRSELTITRRGQAHLRSSGVRADASTRSTGFDDDGNPDDVPPLPPLDTRHNREKQRWLALDRPFLVELGVTTPEHALIPALARKWRQINKFIEVFAAALAASKLAAARQVRVVDFGAGKGYLTFAMHDWLCHARAIDAEVTGVELRPELVRLANAAIDRLGLQGLRFVQGDLHHWPPASLDVMIALHACDTATDHALSLGIRGGAAILLCSPCCHKQIRPQLLSPHPLRPLLQHGVHLGQEAEMVTDGLRALLLEAAGYDTQVFEFISLEHTNKNKMILGVKRPTPKPVAPLLAQIAEIKAFYGIREHCLETLLRGTIAGNPA